MIYTITRFMIKYRYAILVITTIVTVFGAGFYIRSLMAENDSLKTEMQGLEDWIEEYQAEISQCTSDKALAEKESREYQNSNVSLRRDRDRLRKESGCVLPEPSSTPSIHPGTGNQLPTRNGVRVEWLYDFAGRAEQDRITGEACLRFMDKLYISRGYND